jgi:ADP-ribose pyrophosphatase YjhB (NUDIX family)
MWMPGAIMAKRDIRYQGAIVQEDKILLIMHHALKSDLCYWVIPGGGRMDGETEEECVIREMREETNLEVQVLRLLIDEPSPAEGVYRWNKTYLCKPVGGEASPGFEPEPEAASEYAISQVKWFDLRNDSAWEPKLVEDPFTYPTLQKIRRLLGYLMGKQNQIQT